ncbi:MAG: bifunctional demethylmenaquinone methyltransferase/2-methoxy-6-polyprenyl-1,4-benzoquinol methylase UbiE [Bacteroidales bacterium]|nr:bifunctional demethylmenaquinone methyltransferase/2-methoxy-6-polyprenyl-1,4-benzoquinol methylase UbiE [Bacteroidales bacterium]
MAYDFDKIARTYDRLNRLMTLGLDRCWRKRAVKGLHGEILDVACGTGDMAVNLVRQGCTVTGVDISEEMLAIAKQKAPDATYIVADAEQLPFEDKTFDAVTCAFGVRNFLHLKQGLDEMIRVLKPGGRMVILELATPDCALVRPFYRLYTKYVIPRLGQWLAGNREAYTYLPESIERFPKGESFLKMFPFEGIQRKLTFGVCRLYTINKEAADNERPLCY